MEKLGIQWAIFRRVKIGVDKICENMKDFDKHLKKWSKKWIFRVYIADF